MMFTWKFIETHQLGNFELGMPKANIPTVKTDNQLGYDVWLDIGTFERYNIRKLFF